MGTPALARRCDVGTNYASHRASRATGYPSVGWVVWTFLSSLGENGFFSVLLKCRLPFGEEPSRRFDREMPGGLSGIRTKGTPGSSAPARGRMEGRMSGLLKDLATLTSAVRIWLEH